MQENIGQIIILILSLAGWAWSAFPTLRYLVHWSEGDFRWPLVGWFLLLTACIFGIKMSTYAITAWPAPGSWSSRLFFPTGLVCAYTLPFIREYLKHWSQRLFK